MNFEHSGYIREVGFLVPADWMDHWGDMELMVFIHGGNQSVTEFMASTEFYALISGGLTGVKEKAVGIFLQGLGNGKDGMTVGGWNSGTIDQNGAILASDDVDVVATAVQLVQLALYNQRLAMGRAPLTEVVTLSLGSGPIPLGAAAPAPTEIELPMRFWANARSVAIGFSNGGQLVYRMAAELPWFFDVHAVVGSCAGGWYAESDNLVLGLPADIHWKPPTTLAPIPILEVQLGQTLTTNLIHIHGAADGKVDMAGGRGDANENGVDETVEADHEDYYRYDLSVDQSIEPFIQALPGGGAFTVAAPHFTVDLFPANPGHVIADYWEGTTGYAVARVIDDTLDHEYPPGTTGQPWHATAEILSFARTYA